LVFSLFLLLSYCASPLIVKDEITSLRNLRLFLTSIDADSVRFLKSEIAFRIEASVRTLFFQSWNSFYSELKICILNLASLLVEGQYRILHFSLYRGSSMYIFILFKLFDNDMLR
jgi:hypothetical protein